MTEARDDVENVPAEVQQERAGPAKHALGAWLPVIIILLVAAGARRYSIDRESYWIDEFYTLETSAGNGLAHEDIPVNQWLNLPPPSTTDVATGGGFAGIVRHAPFDTQAPLYFMMLNVWRRLFGSSEAAVRGLSAVCSIAAVPAIGWLLHVLTAPRRSVILGMALAAVSGVQIAFAQEARPYAMALLWVVCAAIALARIERAGHSLARGSALALALLALVLTHYTGAGCAIALLVYAILQLKGRTRARTLAAFIIAGLVFAAIWGPIVMRQRTEALDRLVFLKEDSAGHLARTLDRIICQPFLMLMYAPSISAPPAGWQWVARAFGVVVFAMPVVLMVRRQARWILLPWLLLVFPIVQSAVTDMLLTRRALELPRFSFLASGGAITVTAGLIAWLRPIVLSWIASVATLGVMAASLILPGILGRPSPYDRDKPEFRRFARELRADAQTGDALLVAIPPGQRWQSGTLLIALREYAGAWPGQAP